MTAYERIDDREIFDGKCRESHELRYKLALVEIEDGDHVLDAGCGTGYGRTILEEKDIHYHGIDRDPPEGEGFSTYNFETDEPFDEHYDSFVGLEIIEHLDDKGVENFVTLAKQANRTIIVSTPIVRNSNPFHKQQFSEQDIIDLFTDENWEESTVITQDDIYGIFIFERIQHL